MDYRLKKQKDFDFVFNKGIRSYSKTITLLYVKSKDLKFGISLSKKHGKAVLRNRIKRIIRAAFKSYIKNIKEGYYIVLLPKVSDNYNFFDIKKDIEFLLKKGNIING